jgi:hypothetical protein
VTPIRTTLETAHAAAAPALGRLSLILESRRGLTPLVLQEIATAFATAADALLTLLPPERKGKEVA